MSTDRRELNITHSGSPAAARTMYDERFLVPMRRDLTEVGFTELRTAEEVDEALKDKPGTAMVLVNSVCGCSARMARPAARIAIQHAARSLLYGICRAGRRGDGKSSRVLHGLSTLIAVHRDSSRR